MKIFKKIVLGVGLATLLAVVFQFIPAHRTLAVTSTDFNLRFGDAQGKTIIGKYNNKSFTFTQAVSTAGSEAYVTADDNSICKGSTLILQDNESQLASDVKNGTNIDTYSGSQQVSNFQYRAAGSTACKTYNGRLAINPAGGGSAPSSNINWSGAKGSLSADGSQISIRFSDGSNLVVTDKTPGDSTINFKPQSGGKLGGAQVTGWCSDTILGADSVKGVTLSSYTDKTAAVNICYLTPAQVNQTASLAVDVSAYQPPATTTGPTGSCESNFNSPFAWVFCPAFGIADEAANQFNSFVQDQLCFNTGDTSSTSGVVCGGNNNLNTGVHNAWSIFKNIASALLVIALLVMVISQAIGGGPLDAYTIRKMLPKLVAAVILMQISWPLLKWSIDLSNDAGAAVGNLIMAPFGGASKLTLDHLLTVNLGTHTTTTNNEFSLFVVLAAGIGALALSIPGLAMMALYVVLALFTAFVVLIFRKLLIILLVILAPIAFIAWVLPGTERYWKMWRENLTKLILMFPMIMGLIAAGKIFASITAGTSATILIPHLAFTHVGGLPVPYFGTVTNFVNFAIIVGAYFAPFFMLPQTFKWGGAAMGAIANGVQKGVEKGSEPAKKYPTWRRDISPWKQARAARRAKQELRAKTNFYNDLNAGGPIGTVRRARLGGVPTPTLAGIRRERALRSSIVEGGAKRAEEEALKESKEALEHELATDPAALANHDAFVADIVRAGPGENIHGRVRTEADWRAAIEKMLQYGARGNRIFEEQHAQHMALAPADPARIRWEKFLNDNSGTIIPKFPYIYKSRDYPLGGDLAATISQLGPESFTTTGVEGEAIETMLGHLSQLIAAGGPGADQARRDLVSVITRFNQAITSEATNRRINPAIARAVRAAVIDDPAFLSTAVNPATGLRIGEIARGRGAPGVPDIDGATIASELHDAANGTGAFAGAPPDAYVGTSVANITNIVRSDGGVAP
jgi:hypothetical protein